MPRLSNQLPKYRRHSFRDIAFVVIDGRRKYLPGRFGSKESKAEYQRLCAEWVARGRPVGHAPKARSGSIAELMKRYWEFAKRHYSKDGKPTEESFCMRAALRPVLELYGPTPAAEFGPLKLKAVREKMIALGWARKTINQNISRVRRMFRWAVSEELVPALTWQSLSAVQGLQFGRTEARETNPILPIDEATINATLPHLPPILADMVRIQRLTGMRPAEVCLLRPSDIDRTNTIWRFSPLEHKTQYRGRERNIFLGPKAQVVLMPYLDRPPQSFCFQPAEAEDARRAKLHEARTTPLGYGNAPGTNRKRAPQRQPGGRYDADSYRRAITRACEIAFGMPDHLRSIDRKLNKSEVLKLRAEASKWREKHCWSPNRLRHTAATQIRAQFGAEAARTVLGHAELSTTQIYAERDEKLAEQVAQILG